MLKIILQIKKNVSLFSQALNPIIGIKLMEIIMVQNIKTSDKIYTAKGGDTLSPPLAIFKKLLCKNYKK